MVFEGQDLYLLLPVSPFQPVLLPASSFQPASAKFHLKIQQDASEIAGVVEKEEVVLLPVRNAFPCGDERKAINQRFDALFKRLKKDGLLHEPEKDEFLEPVVLDKIMISTPPAEISYEEEANGQLCLFG